MTQFKFTKDHLPYVFSAVACGIVFIMWLLLLKILSWPLSIQRHVLERQLHQIQVLHSLPRKWEHQTRFMEVSELMGILSKNWQALLPKAGVIQIEQVTRTQLKARASQIDEQAFIQWLWAMQQQYAFKVIQLKITTTSVPTIVDVQFSLELLTH